MNPSSGVTTDSRLVAALAIAAACILALSSAASAAAPNSPWNYLDRISAPDGGGPAMKYLQPPDNGPAGMGRVGERFIALLDWGVPDIIPKSHLVREAQAQDFEVGTFGPPSGPILMHDPGARLPAGLRLSDGLSGNAMSVIDGVPTAPFNGSVIVGFSFPNRDRHHLIDWARIDFSIAPAVDAACAAEGGAGMPTPMPGGPIFQPPGPVTPTPAPSGNVPIGTTPPGATTRSAGPRVKLDRCDRERLGMPLVSVERTSARKGSLTRSAMPRGWSLRVIGAKRRSQLRKPSSGTRVLTERPGPNSQRRRRTTVRLPKAVRVVRAFWTMKGEKPIAGFVKDVLKPM
jgi:hypothetical protein